MRISTCKLHLCPSRLADISRVLPWNPTKYSPHHGLKKLQWERVIVFVETRLVILFTELNGILVIFVILESIPQVAINQTLRFWLLFITLLPANAIHSISIVVGLVDLVMKQAPVVFVADVRPHKPCHNFSVVSRR